MYSGEREREREKERAREVEIRILSMLGTSFVWGTEDDAQH